MIGLIFATRTEARPFLEWSRAMPIDTKPFSVFQVPSKPELFVIISGMGKVASAVACHCLIKEFKVEEIVNAGACGALRDEKRFAPGELFCITSAAEGDHEKPGTPRQPLISDGQVDWDLPPARLMTCDRPVFDVEWRSKLAEGGDLVDMEGAAIARVAAMHDVRWSMVKGITDTAVPTDRAELKRNLTAVSEKICRLLWRQLRND
jgi:adenosylhomocysteine nucleosidase